MRQMIITACALTVAGCFNPADSPEPWHDDVTSCEFVLGEPNADHYAMWVQTYEIAQTLWCQTPCPIRVTIIETPEELIYFDGEWQEWQIGRAGFASYGGKLPEIFIAGFYPDEFIPLIMAHELVHVVWRIREHPDTFWERNEELLIAMGII